MPRANPPRQSRVYGARGYPAGPVAGDQAESDAREDHSVFDFLALPLDVAKLIYEAAVKDIREVHLPSSGPLRSVSLHPLAALNKQTRHDFLEIFQPGHRASCYVVNIYDFNFGRLIRYLQSDGGARLRVPRLVVKARHFVKSNDLPHDNIIKFLRFMKRQHFEIRHVVAGMPPASQRRDFMAQLFQLELNTKDEYPDVEILGTWFRLWWASGEGEFDWARQEGDDGMEDGDTEYVDDVALAGAGGVHAGGAAQTGETSHDGNETEEWSDSEDSSDEDGS